MVGRPRQGVRVVSVVPGFRRVTLYRGGVAVDVALPDRVPLAELYPRLLELGRRHAGWDGAGAEAPGAGKAEARGPQVRDAQVGDAEVYRGPLRLLRLDGRPLDDTRCLAEQGVADGVSLLVSDRAEALPGPAVPEEAVEVVAQVVAEGGAGGVSVRYAALLAGGLASVALTAVAAFRALGPRLPEVRWPGAALAVLLLAAAGSRGSRPSAGERCVWLGLALLAAAASGVAAGWPAAPAGPGATAVRAALGGAAALGLAALVALRLFRGHRAPLAALAALVVLAVAAAGGLAAVRCGCPPWRVETLVDCALVALLGLAPVLAVRGSRLPAEWPVPPPGPGGEAEPDRRAPELPTPGGGVLRRTRRAVADAQAVYAGLAVAAAGAAGAAGCLLALARGRPADLVAVVCGLVTLLAARGRRPPWLGPGLAAAGGAQVAVVVFAEAARGLRAATPSAGWWLFPALAGAASLTTACRLARGSGAAAASSPPPRLSWLLDVAERVGVAVLPALGVVFSGILGAVYARAGG